MNYDMLKTRHRENLILKACIEGKTKFVVDNTNLTRQERARYLALAKGAGFNVVGYFFQSRVVDALRRNSDRDEAERVPDKGVLGASGRLELPSKAEGFDQLFFVRRRLKADMELPMKEAYEAFILDRLRQKPG